MTKKDLVKESNFQEYGEVRVDSKNRITLGRAEQGRAFSYKIYRNSLGQIILDPQVTIPAYEAWLFKNEEAKQLVQKGLHEAKSRRLVKADEDYSNYIKD